MKVEVETLRALGLTEYGARAYAALVSLGPSGAAAVAAAAPVPRTKVYAVLADLARRGWAEHDGGRPRTYRAKPPRECFERERARLARLADETLPALEARYRDRATRFAGAIWILDGDEAVAAKTLEMVRAARRDVVLVASFPLPCDAKALPRALREALRRGARVRVALPDAEAPWARALRDAGGETRGLALPPRVLLVDGAQALVAVPPLGTGAVTGVWNPWPELLRVMGPFFLALWESAAPLEEAR